MDRALESLSAFLCDQLERKRLPKPMLALCKYMAELVDEDGYLAQEDLDGLTELKIPADMVERALDTLQSLEPAGVGARDLSECLVLQLSRQKQPVPYAMDIAARFLTELGRGHYGPIAKALGADTAEIQAAEKAIAALDPHPGRAFGAGGADSLRAAGRIRGGTGRSIAGGAERILSAENLREPLL